MRLKIAGGHLFDPATGLHGQVGDLYIANDRIVPALERVDEVWEVQGQAVVPGGIALRAPVASFGLHLLGLRGEAPSPRAAGEAFARLGYTHVHEPYLTLTTAPAVHHHLAGLAVVDASASLVVNLRELDLAFQEEAKLSEVGTSLEHLLQRSRCLDFRVVEPYVRYHQDYYAHRSLDPPRTLARLAALASQLGRRFTLEAGPELLGGALTAPEWFHLSGLSQALVGEAQTEAAVHLLEAGATADLGLALPGPPQTPVQVDLGWFAPCTLNARPSQEGVRRALGLALAYPGRGLAFSHFGAVARLESDYPRLFAWLWAPGARPPEWRQALPESQWSLSDWVFATRTLPAQILDLQDRGRLSPGARADVALYDLPPEEARPEWARLLGRCRTLIKAGEVVIRDFLMVKTDVARHTLFRRTGAPETALVQQLCQARSLRPENLWMAAELGGPFAGV